VGRVRHREAVVEEQLRVVERAVVEHYLRAETARRSERRRRARARARTRGLARRPKQRSAPRRYGVRDAACPISTG